MQNIGARVFYADIVLGNTAVFYLVNAVENSNAVRIMHNKVAHRDVLQRAYLLSLFLFGNTPPCLVNGGVSKHAQSAFKVLHTRGKRSRRDYHLARHNVLGGVVKLRVKAVLGEVVSEVFRALFRSRENIAAHAAPEISAHFVFKYLVFSAPRGGLNSTVSIYHSSQLNSAAAQERIEVNARSLLQQGVQFRL